MMLSGFFRVWALGGELWFVRMQGEGLGVASVRQCVITAVQQWRNQTNAPARRFRALSLRADPKVRLSHTPQSKWSCGAAKACNVFTTDLGRRWVVPVCALALHVSSAESGLAVELKLPRTGVRHPSLDAVAPECPSNDHCSLLFADPNYFITLQSPDSASAIRREAPKGLESKRMLSLRKEKFSARRFLLSNRSDPILRFHLNGRSTKYVCGFKKSSDSLGDKMLFPAPRGERSPNVGTTALASAQKEAWSLLNMGLHHPQHAPGRSEFCRGQSHRQVAFVCLGGNETQPCRRKCTRQRDKQACPLGDLWGLSDNPNKRQKDALHRSVEWPLPPKQFSVPFCQMSPNWLPE
eukprot:evm.model.scf_351.2 EVM.evm.TU.scf_351.2   scf_351:18486-19541(-)